MSENVLELFKQYGANIIPTDRHKKPLVQWKPYQDKQYAGTYPQNCNYAIVVGKTSNNLFALDLDNEQQFKVFKEAKILDQTVVVQTGYDEKKGYGHHIWYRDTSGKATNVNLLHKEGYLLEVKAQNELVTIPPSIHGESNRQYEIISHTKVIKEVEFENLIAVLKDIGYEDRIAKLPSVEQILKTVPVGERHGSAFKLTCYLVQKRKLDSGTVWYELQKWNTEACEQPLTHDQLRQVFESAYKYMRKEYEDESKQSAPSLNGTFEEKVLAVLYSVIKEDERYAKQMIYAQLSAYADPYNVGSLAPTSEGKTYGAVQPANLLPHKDVWFLGGISPTAIIHDHGILVDENSNPIADRVDNLEDEILELTAYVKESKGKDADSKKKLEALKKEKKELLNNAYYLVDMTRKILLFLEPPHQETWARVKPILSHDKYEIQFRVTEKTGRGRLFVNKIVVRGFPVSVFCSARDDLNQWSMWEEIQSRHEITSPNMALIKYLQANKLSAIRKGLPQSVVEAKIDLGKVREAERYINEIITRITGLQLAVKAVSSQPYPNLSWVPYADLISEIFPHETGVRMREFHRLLSKVSTIALCHMSERPFIKIQGVPYIITTIFDLQEAIEITTLSVDLPPFKAKWYEEVFQNAIKSKQEGLQPASQQMKVIDDVNNQNQEQQESPSMLQVGVTSKEISEYIATKLNKTLAPRKVYTRYLYPLESEGMIRMEKDKEDQRRNLYFLESLNSKGAAKPLSIERVKELFTLDYLRNCYDDLKQTMNGQDIKIECGRKEIEIEELYGIILGDTKGIQ